MKDEINTPADAGTEDVQTDQTETAPDWDFFDPDEDTEETAETEATDDDGTETDDDPEATEAKTDDEAEEGEEEGEEQESEPEYFDLPDGTKVERDEVVKGYLRQSDYTRKSTEVAEYRKSIEAESSRIQGITETFVEHLSKLVPQAPDPELALTDPNAYTRQKAQHEAAVAQVQKLIEVGEQAKEAGEALSEADRQKTLAEENRKLAEKFPATTNPKGRDAFFSGAAEAAKELGFSMEELGQVSDHRMFALAHWANEGMKAAKARDTAKQKAAKAPPATPTKPGQPKKQNRNAEAMRKLARSGSIRDALAVDFD